MKVALLAMFAALVLPVLAVQAEETATADGTAELVQLLGSVEESVSSVPAPVDLAAIDNAPQVCNIRCRTTGNPLFCDEQCQDAAKCRPDFFGSAWGWCVFQ